MSLTKYLLSTFLMVLFLSTVAWAQQDTTFFNRHWQEIPNVKDATFYRITKDTTGGIWVKDYYANSGSLQMEGKAIQLKPERFAGLVSWYYRNGNKQRTTNFNQGKEQRSIFYYRNGQLKVEKYEKNGTSYFPKYFTKEGEAVLKEGSGTIIEKHGNTVIHLVIKDSTMSSSYRINKAKDDTTYLRTPVEPSYAGGKRALWQFLQENMNYSKKMKKQKDKVAVWVAFVVDKQGHTKNIHARTRNLNNDFKREAKRVIKLTQWKPAELEDGTKVEMRKRVPVIFPAK